jgi:hypothetical protein
MSNRNFSDFMAYFEVPFEDKNPDLYGTITPEEAKAFIKRILDIIHTNESSLFEEPTTQEGMMITCGRDARYVHDRLIRFLCVFSESVVTNTKVVFS